MKSILIASDNLQEAEIIQNSLEKKFKADLAANDKEIFNYLHKKRYEIIFIDVKYLHQQKERPDIGDLKAGLGRFWDIYPSIQIIVMSPLDKIRNAVMAVKSGASNYLTYPINAVELKYLTDNIQEELRLQSELDYLRGHFWSQDSYEIVKTNSPLMKKVFNKIRSAAPTISTILLLGETGTGKGVIAHLIHRHSNRNGNQFIGVHCGALSDSLLESELFGHEKGAFTGAIKRKMGKFETAHKGTIFLDEIGAISASMQIKLLKVLQEKTFERVGGEESIEVDVRIIAATNADLKSMSLSGSFRTDLYYRLNVFPIEIPPLRERIEDLEILIRFFLNRLNRFYSKDIEEIHPSVLEAFRRYSWPGNIRELENLIERAYILESSHTLTPESFPGELFNNGALLSHNPIDISLTLEEVRHKGVETIERQYLKKLLKHHKGIIKTSAQRAGIGVRQLHKLLVKYEIRKEDYK